MIAQGCRLLTLETNCRNPHLLVADLSVDIAEMRIVRNTEAQDVTIHWRVSAPRLSAMRDARCAMRDAKCEMRNA